jgi:hypothetical protein
MPLVNDGYGCVREEANPHTGTAELFWRPLDPVKDNADAKGSQSPDWSEGDTAWDYKSILKFTAKEWAYENKAPFSWFVTTSPATTWLRGMAGNWANVTTTIYVFVAPHVEVRRVPLSLGYWFKEPDIHVVRVDSVLEVPPPGREPNLGHLLGDRPTLEYFDGRLSGGDLMDQVNAGAVYDSDDTLSIPDVRIRRDLLSFIVEKPTHFQIRINLREDKPSFFRIAILPHQPKAREIKLPPGWEDYPQAPVMTEREINATLFRVIHDANTTVEFHVNGGAKSGLSNVRAILETRKVWHKPKRQDRPVTPFWASDDPVPETASTIVEDRFADPYYYDFKSGEWTEIEPDPDWYGIDTLFQLGIGFIPVVGQLYDVADILSVAVTGKDLWGARKSKSEIVLMGGFAMLGVLGDLSRHVDTGAMERIGAHFFGSAKIVSHNPNFARFLVRAAYSGTPAFTHAGEVLAKKHGDEFMREMDRLILAGDDAGLEALAKKFEAEFDAVMRANARGIDFEQQPATIAMLREQRERFGTALKNLDAATTTKTDEIMRVWDAAHAEDSLHDVIAKIRAIDSQAANALINGLREQIIFDINSDPTIIRRAAAYAGRHGLTGFFAKHKVPFSPYAYLTKVTKKGTEAREAFDLKFGEGAWQIVTGRKPSPDPDTMIARYKGSIVTWLNDIDTYFNHREMIRTKFPGLGIILNSDHVIEARFRKVEAIGGSVDAELFRAILVPPSLEIAQKLRDEGIDIGWYIHQHKTSRMNQLLPQREAQYTIEEIADAYQLFWVHEMKMTPSMFRNLFEEELQYLDMARKGIHVMEGTHNPNAGRFIFTSFKSKDELLKSVNARLKKMALPQFIEAKVGERVSDAPGLG